MFLWLHFIDYDRSYRSVSVALSAALPASGSCIIGRGLGSTQRAAFHYFAGIKTLREGSQGTNACKLFLAQGVAQKETLLAGSGWRKIWEGSRPSDRNERFRLYTRP